MAGVEPDLLAPYLPSTCVGRQRLHVAAGALHRLRLVGSNPRKTTTTAKAAIMTVIIGVQHRGGVTIGADSAASDGDRVVVRSDSKLFKVGPYLFGFCGSFRAGQLLRYALEPSRPPYQDLDRFMVTTFVDEIRCCLRDGGVASRANEVEEIPSSFLVGVAGRLFCVESDYQVGAYVDGFAAVGSGQEIALGSLHSTSRYDFTPKQRVQLALEAAAYYNPFVRAPFTIQTLKG